MVIVRNYKVTNYLDAVIPIDKDTKTYNKIERRASILREILEKGHPGLVNKTDMARKYNVNVKTIYRDFNYIADNIKENIGTNAELVTKSVYDKAIKKLISGTNKDMFFATKVIKDWNDFLFDSGVRERATEKIEIEHKGELILKDIKKFFEKEEVKK